MTAAEMARQILAICAESGDSLRVKVACYDLAQQALREESAPPEPTPAPRLRRRRVPGGEVVESPAGDVA